MKPRFQYLKRIFLRFRIRVGRFTKRRRGEVRAGTIARAYTTTMVLNCKFVHSRHAPVDHLPTMELEGVESGRRHGEGFGRGDKS